MTLNTSLVNYYMAQHKKGVLTLISMVGRLIAGEDLATLQVLWQPKFIPGETA
ncbi:ThuR [Klebsiella pneumoniae]|nr:ThuR [Klebsiella pneumoniae]